MLSGDIHNPPDPQVCAPAGALQTFFLSSPSPLIAPFRLLLLCPEEPARLINRTPNKQPPDQAGSLGYASGREGKEGSQEESREEKKMRQQVE